MKTVKALYLKNLKEKTLGLLKFERPKPVYFKTRFGIHTFFMKFPIDVVILDNKKTVVKMRINLKPNGIFLWKPKYENVVELPVGFIEENEIRLGEIIDLKLF